MTLVSRNGLILLLNLIIALALESTIWATEIRIPPLSAKPGETLQVPVMVDEIDNLAGVRIVLKYEPDILVYRQGTKTKDTDSLMHIINDKNPGILIVVMAGAKGIKGKEFPILLLTFEIKQEAKGTHTTKINITDAQLMSDDLKEIKCSVLSNPITIQSARPH
jgi:hypothetical protein